MSTFRDVALSFVDSYGAYRAHMKIPGAVDNKRDCHILFGVAGAGKSTLVARLVAQLSPERFCVELSAPSAVISGVKIGNEAETTTLIPKTYQIGALQVCDMPGFNDNMPVKRIIIGVLQKCFLTAMQNKMFLVVIDINAIKHKSFDVLRLYCNALRKLFSDSFDRCVGRLHFILTRNDRAQMAADEIENQLVTVVVDAAPHNDPGLSRFLRRIHESHMTVDYTVDTFDDVKRRMTAMLARDQAGPLEAKAMTMNVNFTTMDLAQDELNALCRAEIEQLAAQRDALKKLHDAAYTELAARDAELNSCVATTVKEHAELCDSHERTILREKVVQEEIADFPRIEERLMATILLNSQRKDFSERTTEFFNTNAPHFEHITLLEMTSKNNKVNVIIDISDESRKNYVLLVTLHEPNDKSLMDYIGNGTLIPEALSKVEKFSSPAVLFNSKRQHGTEAIKLVSENHGQHLVLTAKLGKPFKVFVYFSVPFERTGASSWMSAAHRSEKQHYEQRCTEAATNLETLRSKNQQNLLEACSLKEQKAALSNSIFLSAGSLATLQTRVKEAARERDLILNRQEAAIREQLNQESVKLLCKIAEIFHENGLTTTLTGDVQEFGIHVEAHLQIHTKEKAPQLRSTFPKQSSEIEEEMKRVPMDQKQ